MKIFAIDYDNTYGDDPELWNEFIVSAKQRGHVVIMVTYRSPDIPILDAPNIEIIYTDHNHKAPYLMEHHDIDVDVWIDDWPELIGKTR